MRHKWHFHYLRHDRKVANVDLLRSSLRNFMTNGSFDSEDWSNRMIMVMKSRKNENHNSRRHRDSVNYGATETRIERLMGS